MQTSNNESIPSEIDRLEKRLRRLRKEAKRSEREERKAPSWEPILGAIGLVLVFSTVMVVELFLFSRADGHIDPSESTLLRVPVLFLAVLGIAFVWVLVNHIVYSRQRQKELTPIREESAQHIQEARLELDQAKERWESSKN